MKVESELPRYMAPFAVEAALASKIFRSSAYKH